MFRSKTTVADFPYHPPAQVQDILLRKVERFFASGKRLEELAGENATVKAVLLRRGISRGVILPTSKIEWRFLFVAVLKIDILAQKLENSPSIIMHAVERLDPFLPKVDSCSSPMYIAMVDRNENRVLAENVYLFGPLRQAPLLISLFLQLCPEEGAEEVDVQWLLLFGLAVGSRILLASFGTAQDQCTVKVDHFVVEPFKWLQPDNVLV